MTISAVGMGSCRHPAGPSRTAGLDWPTCWSFAQCMLGSFQQPGAAPNSSTSGRCELSESAAALPGGACCPCRHTASAAAAAAAGSAAHAWWQHHSSAAATAACGHRMCSEVKGHFVSAAPALPAGAAGWFRPQLGSQMSPVCALPLTFSSLQCSSITCATAAASWRPGQTLSVRWAHHWQRCRRCRLARCPPALPALLGLPHLHRTRPRAACRWSPPRCRAHPSPLQEQERGRVRPRLAGGRGRVDPPISASN